MPSVNQRKQTALDTIGEFKGVPPRGLLAALAGIHQTTLLDWEKDDPKFKEELDTILQEKRLKLATKLYEKYDQCLDELHYPAIKDGLKAIDPEMWAEPEDTKVTTVNIMYLDIGPGRGNGKAKKIVNGKHRLK